MKALATLTLASLLVVAFSGCFADDGGKKEVRESTTAPPPEFTDETGAITGMVVNDENLPVEAAEIAIQDSEHSVLTDATGAFTLSNLAPGIYTVFAQKLGFETAAKKVEVVAGSAVQVQLTLRTIAIETAYHTTQIGNGYIQCSVRAYPGVPTAGTGGLPMWVTGAALCAIAPIPTLPADKFLLIYPVEAQLSELLLEMQWTSTQASGKGLSVVVEHDGHPNQAAFTFGNDIGPSPLEVHTNGVKMANLTETSGIDCAEAPCKIMTRVFAAANTTEFYLPAEPPELGPLGKPPNKIDAGFVFDQKFTQYLTSFHLQARPDGFSALSDA